MCQVADALISKGERQGILKGRLEGKVELLSEMNFSISDISKRVKISEEEVKNILEQSSKS
ncbi:MAG: transposase family protein [Lachnospiraceae bacterium]|nr:transposase family protein [Lachnospiraceae bacterium]